MNILKQSLIENLLPSVLKMMDSPATETMLANYINEFTNVPAPPGYSKPYASFQVINEGDHQRVFLIIICHKRENGIITDTKKLKSEPFMAMLKNLLTPAK